MPVAIRAPRDSGGAARTALARAIRLEFLARLELLGNAQQRGALARWLACVALDALPSIPYVEQLLARRIRLVLDAQAKRARRVAAGALRDRKANKHLSPPWDALADDATGAILRVFALTDQQVNAAMAWRRQQVRRQSTRKAEALVPSFLVEIGRAAKRTRARAKRQK